MRHITVFTLLLAGTLLLSACETLRFPGVYRIDIPQGNFVTEDMLAQLEPGMTPDQVRYVLGQPTLRDPFTPDTWFYPMVYQPGRGDTVRQRIVVHFENEQYVRHEGAVIEDFRSKVTGQQDRDLEQQLREQEREAQQDGQQTVPGQPPGQPPAQGPGPIPTDPGVPPI